MKRNQPASLFKWLQTKQMLHQEQIASCTRQVTAVVLSVLMVQFTQLAAVAQDGYYPPPPPPDQYNQQPQYQYAQQPNGYVPLDAESLDRLVAPIALYPDALVAQVLTAATYPQQVAEANNFARESGGMPPQQLAQAVNTMPWDPSVKALTATPSVLDNLARNYQWASALGNAYYNQPGDVMNAVQAMRFRAQEAGTLRSSSQLRVYDEGGQVLITPTNPEVVYVPYYDPWRVYGVPLAAWGGYYYAPPPRGVIFAGGLGIGFAAGIAIGAFAGFGWGYHHWSPNWRGGTVVYNNNTYISRSTTIVNRGNFGAYNRGVFERPGAGVPNNFRPPVTQSTAAFRSNPGFNRPGNAPGQFNRPGVAPNGQPQFEGRGNNGQFNRPGAPPSQFNRQPNQSAPAAQFNRPGVAPQQGQPQQFSRPQQAPPAQFNRPQNVPQQQVPQQFSRPQAAPQQQAPQQFSRPQPAPQQQAPQQRFERPAPQFNRPAPQAAPPQQFSRPAPQAAPPQNFSRPAPQAAPQHSAPAPAQHAAPPQHGGGGGGHEEHHH